MTPERTARFSKPLGLAVAIALLALIAFAATALANSGSPAPGSPAGGLGVSIIQKTFNPAEITVSMGDTVTWTVTEAIAEPHSVTSGNYKDATTGTEFDSKITLKDNGNTFQHTFTTVGVFPYFCQVHPDVMTGSVTVVAPGASGAPGQEGPERGPIDSSTKLIAAGILGAAIVLMLGWAWMYRRMNP
jgi:plastocyanin